MVDYNHGYDADNDGEGECVVPDVVLDDAGVKGVPVSEILYHYY